MTPAEIETLLRGVPWRPCPTCDCEGHSIKTCAFGAEPDYAAMAQAVREIEEERDRKGAATLAREINNANRLLAERDALQAEIARLRAALRKLRTLIGAPEKDDLQQTRLHKAVVGGLNQCIGDHKQPITRAEVGIAAKRITKIVSDFLNAALTPPDAPGQG